jgi:penicillin-binding protein 2
MAGKTGTAQTSHVSLKDTEPARAWYYNRDHAWFAGFAPAKSPEIAIVVLIEHGGAGGRAAAPVAMQVARDYQRLQSSRLASHANPGRTGQTTPTGTKR